MKKWMKTLAISGIAALIGLSSQAMAQQGQGGGQRGQRGQGQFDPEQMRQRMNERLREQFGVKNDAEWQVIQTRIEKVNEARRDVGFGGMGMFGRRPGQRGPGGDQAGANQGGMAGRRFGATPMPEAEALQAAIDSNASADDIKAKLAAYRTARKSRQAKLDQAREELRKVLSVRQEAVAVMNGLLE